MMPDAIAGIKERIASACARSGRPAAGVTLVAVTKNRTVEQVNEAIASGVLVIGENKVQEALSKLADPVLRRSAVSLHMIGHLQSNKAKTQ